MIMLRDHLHLVRQLSFGLNEADVLLLASARCRLITLTSSTVICRLLLDALLRYNQLTHFAHKVCIGHHFFVIKDGIGPASIRLAFEILLVKLTEDPAPGFYCMFISYWLVADYCLLFGLACGGAIV